jgi:hypothetical protein
MTSEANDTASDERDQWLTYLAQLNNRSLSQEGKSGATTWVLVGVLGAIVYKSVPLIPWFLGMPGYLRASYTLFLLISNVLLTLMTVLIGLVRYLGAPQRRLMTDRSRNQQFIFTYVLAFPLWFLLACAQLWVGFACSDSLFVRGSLIGFGLWWLINLSVGILKAAKKHWHARTKKLNLPKFSDVTFGTGKPSLRIAAIVFPFVLLSFSSVIAYILIMAKRSSTMWVPPLSAAVQLWVILVIIVILLWRVVHAGENEAYLSLERAALVENLDSQEIKARFVTQLWGPEIGEWLRSMGPRLVEADSKLRQATTTAKQRLAEIELIDEKYAMERSGRAKEATEELNTQMSEHKSALEKCQLDLKEYVSVGAGASKDEIEMLQSAASQVHTCAPEWREHVVEATTVVASLKRFLAADAGAKR